MGVGAADDDLAVVQYIDPDHAVANQEGGVKDVFDRLAKVVRVDNQTEEVDALPVGVDAGEGFGDLMSVNGRHSQLTSRVFLSVMSLLPFSPVSTSWGRVSGARSARRARRATVRFWCCTLTGPYLRGSTSIARFEDSHELDTRDATVEASGHPSNLVPVAECAPARVSLGSVSAVLASGPGLVVQLVVVAVVEVFRLSAVQSQQRTDAMPLALLIF